MLAIGSHCAAPASAVSPPSIDHSWLPAAARPGPARPTVQRAVCTVPALGAEHAAAPSQLERLDLPSVWRLSRGDGQRVAVIDTGVAPHRRLPRLIGGGDYASSGDGTRDCDGHGTLVAGIIGAAADPETDAFSGVAPEVTVIAIRQSSEKFGAVDEPAHTGIGDIQTLARAVRTAADLGASVINISAVACVPAATGLDDRGLGAALAYAVDSRNAVVVAAAGNADDACPAQGAQTGWDDATVVVSPPWYDDYVLTVGSVTADGAPSAFTLAGPWVDVAAPGEGVLSLSPVGDAMADTVGGQGSAAIAGTSYAAPVVSGLAALIRSRFPGWTPRQVMDRIKATAHHPPGGRNNLVGSGVVDPLAAVSTGAAPATGTAAPAPVAEAAVAPQPAAPEESGRRTALGAAGVLLAVLALGMAGAAATRRSRPIDHVAGD